MSIQVSKVNPIRLRRRGAKPEPIHKGLESKASYRTPILERTLTLIGVDIGCVMLALSMSFSFWAFFVAEWAVTDVGAILAAKWHWFPIVAIAWFASAWVTDLYDVATSGLNAVVVQRSIMSMGVSVVILCGLYFLFPEYIPRSFFLVFVLTVASLTILGRWFQHAIADKNVREHRIMLLGNQGAAQELNTLLRKMQRLNLRLVVWSGENELSQLRIDPGGHDLRRYAADHKIDEIVLTNTRKDRNEEMFRALVECQSNGIRVSSMADLYRKLSRQIPVEYVDSAWVMGALQDRLLFTRIQLGIKRLFDIIGAIIALPVLFLLFPFIAIAIRLDSAGPILYRQVRAGRAGRRFSIIKFRTMSQDAEKDGKARWASQNDPRITRVGLFLRRTRLDELPQFINVLAGDMSLVGPRPERPEIEESLERELPHYFIRRLVKPGITGWAQVHYKYGSSINDSLRKLQYDAYYVRYWSLPMDIYTVLRTVGVMLGSRGQ